MLEYRKENGHFIVTLINTRIIESSKWITRHVTTPTRRPSGTCKDRRVEVVAAVAEVAAAIIIPCTTTTWAVREAAMIHPLTRPRTRLPSCFSRRTHTRARPHHTQRAATCLRHHRRRKPRRSPIRPFRRKRHHPNNPNSRHPWWHKASDRLVTRPNLMVYPAVIPATVLLLHHSQHTGRLKCPSAVWATVLVPWTSDILDNTEKENQKH